MTEQPIRHDGRAQLPALTGVRAFAALMVLALHAGQNFPNWLTNGVLANYGYLGVDLFFILSGFVIAHVYLYDLVPVRVRSLRVFFWHRFVRLFPAHATVLLLLMGTIAVARSTGVELNEQQSWNYRDLPWHFLMVHAWGTTDVAGWNAPSWSISAEWFAYLLFPTVAAGVLALPRGAGLTVAIVALLIAAVLFHSLNWAIEWAWLGAPALLRVASEFICGVLIFRIIRIDIAGLSPWRSDILAFGALAGFVAGAFLINNDFVLIALLAILIAGVSGQGVLVRAVFGCRPVVWLGEISYSIYVVHFPVLLVLRHSVEHITRIHLSEFEAMRATMFIISLAIVIGAASLLYYLIEYPIRRRLRNVVGTIVAQQRLGSSGSLA
jgi:peptidoglycan/LPS O-acetylase OafA/YrhL